MAIKDENQALEAVREVRQFLNDQLTHARFRAQACQAELRNLEHLIESLDSRLKQMNVLMAVWPKEAHKTAADTVTSAPEESLRSVVGILKASTGPMRIKSIAKYAFEKGLIRSTGGLEGVTSIVSNLMSRHSPRLFVNTGWGWWDLAERQHPVPVKASEATGSASSPKPSVLNPPNEPPTPSNLVLLNRKTS